MNVGNIIVLCPQCGAKNRVPSSRWSERAVCGKCKASLDLSRLFPDRPVEISDASFRREVLDFPGLVLLEFQAPW